MTGVSHSGNADWQTRLQSVATGFGLAVGGLVSTMALSLLFLPLFVQAGFTLESNPMVLYPVQTVLTGLGFVLVVALYLAGRGGIGLIEVRVPTLRDLALTVVGVVALVATLVVVGVLFEQLGVQTARHQIADLGRENPSLMLLMLPLAFLVIGPSEELLFRGVIQGVLRQAYRPLPAIVIASLMFGVGHVAALAGPGKTSTILVIVLLGGILGALYEYTDNIVVPTLVHGAYDAIAFSQIYVAATGGL